MTRLAEIRRARGLTMVELARQSGVTQQAISLIESGQRDSNANTLYRLSRALGVTMDELYGAAERDAAREGDDDDAG